MGIDPCECIVLMYTLKNIMKRTSYKTEKHILTQILLGYSYPDIAKGTGVAVSTIKKIKARNKASYDANEKELTHWTTDKAKATLQRTYQLLDGLLIQAEQGAKVLSVKEILLISNQMLIHEHLLTSSKGHPSLKETQQNIDRLMSSFKKGN